MSVICKTFVQNTWRKDLCSNCFKSEEEHGGGAGGAGVGREAGGEAGDFTSSYSKSRGTAHGGVGGGGSRRYMGVAGKVYQRGYYNNSWKSIMIDKSDGGLKSPGLIKSDTGLKSPGLIKAETGLKSPGLIKSDTGLKSPGLIKEMSSLVSQENEKNLIVSDLVEADEKDTLRSPRLSQQVKTSQSEAKLLTEILADKSDSEGSRDKNDHDDRGDVSSDLGSEASTASSGASSACSFEVTCSAANSDTASLRSEPGSEHSAEDKIEDEGTRVPPAGILKKTGQPCGKRRAISFNPELEEVIGFGGDVDYSDDEDAFDDDDDDDYDDFADLTPDERVLRQLTDKNTEFNSDNDNLKKDIEELLPSVKELEEKRKMIIAEIEELERLGRERMKNEKAKQEEKKEDKQEGKVKLKRSPPLVSSKPLIARNNNEVRVNQVLPMKNGQVVRPSPAGEVEESPLKGVKPKYVPREQEMIEKSSLTEEELKINMGKITSIDEVYLPEDTKKARLTSIDDVCVSVVDETVASAGAPKAKPTNTSGPIRDEGSNETKNTTKATDSQKPTSPSSGTEAASSSTKGTSSQNSLKNNRISAISCDQTKERKPEVAGDAKDLRKDVPVSVPRTSIMTHSQPASDGAAKTIVSENRKTSSPPETHKSGSGKSLTGSNKTPSPTERHTKREAPQGSSAASRSLQTSVVSESHRSSKSSQSTVQQTPNKSTKSATEGRLPGDSRTTETKAPGDLSKSSSQPSSTQTAKSSAKPGSTGLSEVPKTQANQSSSVTSKTQSSQDPPESSGTACNQSLPEKSKTVDSESLLEPSRAPSNQNISKTHKRISNQNLPETNRTLSDQNLQDTSRSSSNQCLPEGSETLSNQSRLEASRTSSNQMLPEVPKTQANQSFPETVRIASSQNLSEIQRTPSNSSHPEASRTSSNQSLPENTKAPASRQGSNSSLMTTFGTPVVTSTQNSFLHSSSARSMYDDTYSSPSQLHTPETTDFLKEIKLQPEVRAPTAGIQKSALYASTSCLKGLPGAKPVITPKPPKLKDKPKVPFKPSSNGSIIYATPSPVPLRVPVGSLSGAVSTPNLASASVEDRSDTASTASGSSEASSNSRPDSRPETLYRVTPEVKKPPPTTQAPAIPTSSGPLHTEVVYDVPVTLASTSKQGPPETSSAELKRDDATIYHEIDDTIRDQRLSGVPDQTLGSPSAPASGCTVSQQESTRCQGRSTFEANRSMLSAALDFGVKTLRSSSSKRPAPRPPAEGEEDVEAEEEEAPAPQVSQASTAEETSPLGGPQEPAVAPANDGESFSSFTDDFDDEEEEVQQPTLRKAERSSSAVPHYRNSIASFVTHDLKGSDSSTISAAAVASVSPCPAAGGQLQGANLAISGAVASKPLASRSHSVPRAADHIVNIDPSATGGSDVPTSSTSSKFSFRRSGFFQPSSPPSTKRACDSSAERGRDRSSKKSSAPRFSLKKLLRLGSGGKDGEKKVAKEQEKRLARESKRNKLTIIHPLDYNQAGVEVIARPEKTSPIYDYTGIYGYIPPPQLSSKLEDIYMPISQVTMLQESPALSVASKRSDTSTEASHSPSTAAAPTALLSTAIPPASDPSASFATTCPSTLSSTTCPSTLSSTTCPSTGTGANCTTVTSAVVAPVGTPPAGTTTLDKRGSNPRKEPCLERRESETSHSSSGTASSSPQHHLGYNSEGRPKPPPPPRKVSLESGQAGDFYSTVADLRPHHSPVDTPSRPQRPPPPVRTPSNAGTKSGPPRPDPPKLGKDSVYANLGDVRAPLMPQKPGRTSSIRGEDDREKRRAPQPPQYLQVGQEVEQQATQRGSRHQQEDSISSSCSGISSCRAGKGPAPARPTHTQQEAPAHDDATAFLRCRSESQSASTVLYDAPLPLEARPTSPQDVHTPDGYIIPAQLRSSNVTEGTTSAPSSRQEKTGRVSVRRGSAVRHRSLEDQYGAVISANLEALSNMLDKLSSSCCPAGYEEVGSRVSRWEDIVIDDDIIVGAGHRLFYPGVACGREVTVMLTPETKVEAHHLLTPVPVVTFKDDLPSHLLSHKYITRGKATLGTVWVLPSLSLTTLRRLAEEDNLCSTAVPVEWERNTCLLLLQLVTGLKQLQAQGVEETCIDLTLIARGSQAKEQDSNPRLILVPPTETGRLMSLCQCAAAATLLLMGVDAPLQRAREGNFTIPDMVPSPHAFNILLQLLHQERAGSLTQVKCVLEVLLFGPDSSENDSKEGEEVEAALQRWLDLERATVLHSLIQGPLESSVLTKFHLLFLVRTNSRVLRETIKLLGDPEVTTF